MFISVGRIMKANLTSSLLFDTTENFKKEVLKRIPSGIKEVWLFDCGMNWKGRGNYEYYLTIDIDGSREVFKRSTNDSMAYDFYKGEDRNRNIDNFEKRIVLSLLEDYQDELNEIVNNKL